MHPSDDLVAAAYGDARIRAYEEREREQKQALIFTWVVGMLIVIGGLILSWREGKAGNG